MEYITANGTEYVCRSVTTGTNSISFTMDGKEIAEVEATFRGVESITVAGEDKETYGNYENLNFESATVYAAGSICVTMHIPTEIEQRLADLEATQAEQDEVIAELIGGEA